MNASRKIVLLASALSLTLGGCASANRFVMRLVGQKPVERAEVRPVFHESAQAPTASPTDRLYKAAVQAIEDRDYLRALDALQLARRASPDDVRVLNALGVVYDKMGRFDLSSRYYRLAEAADPASPIIAANMRYSGVLQDMRYLAPLLQPEAAPQPRVQVQAQAPSPAATRMAVVPPALRLAGAYAQDQGPLRALPSRAAAGEPTLRLASASANGSVRRAEPILTGAPLALINASGSALTPEPTRRYLAQAGWTLAARAASAPVRENSEIRYPAREEAVATALARTLPFKVALTACAADCAFQLVLGKDAPTVLKAQPGRS